MGQPPNTEEFQSYMNEPTTNESTSPSPMELAQKQSILPTTQSLMGQLDTSSIHLGDIKSNLNTPKLTLKDSQQQ